MTRYKNSIIMKFQDNYGFYFLIVGNKNVEFLSVESAKSYIDRTSK